MKRAKGFGLLELIVVMVVLTLLTSLAIPTYGNYTQRARVASAIGDISGLSLEVEKFRLKNNGRIPASLEEMGVVMPLDPWGQPYVFLNIPGAGPGKGSVRKDGKLNPLNTDFDLYSIGRDGKTAGPLSNKASRDDVVRASNGAFIGLGEDY